MTTLSELADRLEKELAFQEDLALECDQSSFDFARGRACGIRDLIERLQPVARELRAIEQPVNGYADLRNIHRLAQEAVVTYDSGEVPGRALIARIREIAGSFPKYGGFNTYIGYARWRHREDNQQPYLSLCDSDAEGAFQIYRHPKTAETQQPVNGQLLSALKEFYASHVPKIDNGHCAVCKSGYRMHRWEGRKRFEMPCSNEECITRRIDAAISRAEAAEKAPQPTQEKSDDAVQQQKRTWGG